MKRYRRKEIGAIDGITVYGHYYDEGGEPSVVLMHRKSWQVETDGGALVPDHRRSGWAHARH